MASHYITSSLSFISETVLRVFNYFTDNFDNSNGISSALLSAAFDTLWPLKNVTQNAAII